MQTVKITLADNGVIKTVIDDNINSAGEGFESTMVYDFEIQSNKIKFITELCVDIGLTFGNSKNKRQIQIIEEWGVDYLPSDKEKLEKIEKLEKQLKLLKASIKQ
jgi:septum formation inhibitor MinC